jgi:hypothetical protein
MHRVVGDAELQLQDRGDSAPRPDLATAAIGLGTPVQEVGKAGEWRGGQAPGRARGGAVPQRVGAPPRARFTHWLTAAALTPNAAAIWRCGQPCCLRCQAWSRRASVQF